LTKSVELAQLAGIVLADDTSVTFTPTGMRFKADFSNGTLANRAMFQNSVANSQTSIGVVPSGTATNTSLILFAASTPDNSTLGFIQQTETIFAVSTSKSGTGTYTPMAFYTGGSERARLDTSGNFQLTGGGALGYGTGSGGTVTQATSKSTTVSLDKPVGRITMNAAALAANTTVGFSLNCSFIAATDIILLTIVDASVTSSTNYNIWASVGGGGALIRLRNISAGSLSEAVQINYAVIKGATA